MTERKFYVVSVKWSKRDEPHVIFWRPDAKGYSCPLPWSGLYDESEIRAHLGYYNTGCDAIAVLASAVDALGEDPVPGYIDNNTGPCVRSNADNWKVLLANVIEQPEFPPRPLYRGARRSGSQNQDDTPKRPTKDEQFIEDMKRIRGIDFARIGMMVEVAGEIGTIAGMTSGSGNLAVVFANQVKKGKGKYNCHPTWETRYFNERGEVIADYRKASTQPA
ncbi:hypothetical protein B0G84_2370 [Paraburkholderia sp. BL8N3]|nr:hypothetical protein [Paraburkholderia sp. BL8N3]TCK44022.1 hypothetical protein B0G84_2370 [Paraburkholderia sp. BL8N3]